MKHLNVSFLLTNVPKPVVGWVILSCKSHILLSVSAFEKKNVVPTSLMGDVKTISNNSFPWDKFEINANLFCPSRNKKHGVIWSLFLALHDVIRGKEAVWSWSYWTIVLHWERLCSFFKKLIEETDSEAWRKKKDYCACINAFLLKYAKN